MSTLVWDAVGWSGALALLTAHALLTGGRATATSAGFIALNLFGSAGLAINGAVHTA